MPRIVPGRLPVSRMFSVDITLTPGQTWDRVRDSEVVILDWWSDSQGEGKIELRIDDLIAIRSDLAALRLRAPMYPAIVIELLKHHRNSILAGDISQYDADRILTELSEMIKRFSARIPVYADRNSRIYLTPESAGALSLLAIEVYPVLR